MKKSDIIKTTTGKLKGYIENDLNIFKGIPYAQPPIGDLRFKDTVEKEPWEGVLDTIEYGPIPMQPTIPGSSIENHPHSEDCLTLNIWTPACDNERRAVMFWIHGGGFFYGGAPSPFFNGRFLSQRGNICIVTFNYRLGALGNLYIPDKVSNLGFIDQYTALKWVYDNISYFGGDPANITIFGESAGSTSVCTLLSMPITKPLIRRAICQSGAVDSQGHQAEGGIYYSEKLFNLLRIKIGDINTLREISVSKLIEAEDKIRLERIWGEIKPDIPWYPPIVDGNKIPEHPLVAIKNQGSKNLDLLIGTNLNEWTFFTMLNPQLVNIDWDALTKYINISFNKFNLKKKQIEKIISVYKHSRNTPFEILNAIYTDLAFRYPSIKIAEAQSKNNGNTYMYLFTYKTPVQREFYGATHALEIAFVFGTLGDKNFGAWAPKRDEINSKISSR